MTTAVLVISALAAAALLGIAFLVLGLRGRATNDHPVCRRCKFDLVGVYPREQTCPECGRSLAQRKRVRIGVRARRKGAIAAGALFLLIVVAGAGLVGWGAAANFNFNTIKPLWMLEIEAQSSADAPASAALDELIVRLDDGKLAEADIHRLIESALQRQADESLDWRYGWGTLVQRAWALEMLTDEQIAQYARAAIVADVVLRSIAHVGDNVPMKLEMRSRAGQQSAGFLAAVHIDAIAIGESEITPDLVLRVAPKS